MYSYGSPHMAVQKQDDQLERTFSSYVRIQAVTLKTYLGRWTIGRSGERGSGISVLPARYDDDIYIYIYIYIYREWEKEGENEWEGERGKKRGTDKQTNRQRKSYKRAVICMCSILLVVCKTIKLLRSIQQLFTYPCENGIGKFVEELEKMVV